jgi:fructose/tagatose bisphosphate aldolase
LALITDPLEVEDIYSELEEKNICLPAFCTSDPESTEAALAAGKQFAEEHGIKSLPLCVAFTSTYHMIQQTVCYTVSGDPLLGFRMIMNDLELLTSKDSPYNDLRVMAHLDHGQPDTDSEILENCLDRLASVMYDCSTLPFEENIKRTAEYVERTKGKIRVEAAVDEIYEVGESEEKNELTTPEDAERYFRETGAFLITPNIGTEHRSTQTRVHYDSALAKEISKRVGHRLVIHGTSGLMTDDLAKLRHDGIVKVNIWTILHRLGAQAIAQSTIEQLGNICSSEQIDRLHKDDFLGEKYFQMDYIDDTCSGKIAPKQSHITGKARRDLWIDAVIPQMKAYFEVFGYGDLAN